MYKNSYLGELSKLGLVCPVSAARMTIRVLLKKTLLLRSLPSFCCCYSAVRFTKETSVESVQLAKPSHPSLEDVSHLMLHSVSIKLIGPKWTVIWLSDFYAFSDLSNYKDLRWNKKSKKWTGISEWAVCMLLLLVWFGNTSWAFPWELIHPPTRWRVFVG